MLNRPAFKGFLQEPLTRNLFYGGILLLAALAVYSGGWNNDFLSNWDDPEYITANPDIRSLSLANLKKIFTSYYLFMYSPVHVLSYTIDYSLWGLNPRGFLLANVLLHTLNAFLFLRILTRLGVAPAVALGAALLFTIHPVQVESVAWISQRKSVLSLTFALAAFWQYLDYAEARCSRWRHYALSLVFFLLALLTKMVVVILPAVLLSYDLLLREFRKDLLRMVAEKAPFVLVGIVVAWHAVVDQGNPAPALVGGSVLSEVMTMLTVYQKYLVNLVWPLQLSVEYQVDIKRTLDIGVVTAALLMALTLASPWLVERGRRRGAVFCLAVYLLGFLPVSQIVPFIHLMYDRYLYIPMLGFATGVAVLLNFLGERVRLPPKAALAGAVMLLLLLAGVSWQRTGVWANSLSLWQDATAKQPNSSDAWYGLGSVYDLLENDREAIACYQEAVRINPFNSETRISLASSYVRIYEFELAEQQLLKALELKADAEAAHRNLGFLYMITGDNGAAIVAFESGLRLVPNDLQMQLFLGANCYASGRVVEALRHFAKVRENGVNTEFSAMATSMQALVAWQQGELVTSRRLRQEAMSQGFSEAEIYLNWARLEAVCRNKAQVLDYLREARKLGFADLAALRADPVFLSLHNHAEFMGMVKK